MAKTLVITEKPSVARDIVEALGGFSEHDGYWESDAYVVTFSVGHILELFAPEDVDPVYKRWTLDTLPPLVMFSLPVPPSPTTNRSVTVHIAAPALPSTVTVPLPVEMSPMVPSAVVKLPPPTMSSVPKPDRPILNSLVLIHTEGVVPPPRVT